MCLSKETKVFTCWTAC